MAFPTTAPRGSVAEPDPGKSDALHLGRRKRRLVVAVVAEKPEARPGRRVAVEAPEPFLGGEHGDEGAGDVVDGNARRDRSARVFEVLDGHGPVSHDVFPVW